MLCARQLPQMGCFVPVLLSDIADIEFETTSGELSAFKWPRCGYCQCVAGTRHKCCLDNGCDAGTCRRLNEGVLAQNNLKLNIVYDETGYIASAIDLVQQNIWVGGLLALTILLLFLRSLLPTIAIFIAIPVSVIGTFVAIAGLGLSINVISLAGLAFAVGMVVDASIVSMENIYRLRQSGLAAPDAAYHGARQVWAPILGRR